MSAAKDAKLSSDMRDMLRLVDLRADKLRWQLGGPSSPRSAFWPVAPWILDVPVRTVAALHRRGLITPTPDTADRTSWDMVLTERGREVLTSLEPSI